MIVVRNKPMIALTPYYNIDTEEPYMRPAYLKAVEAAGGIPVVLPLTQSREMMQQLVDTFDGFLFTGGPDIHPFHFGEETQAHCGNVSPRRDILEMTLLPLVMEATKPILGICRGAQLINVTLGGDVYQDIPSQFPEDFPIAHSQPFYYDIPSHTVHVEPGTLLASITKSTVLKVNSMHHQAVRKLAPGLTASAYAANQLIEAIEKPDYPYLLGVQWHPEYLWEADPAGKKIFDTFVSACMP